MRSFSMHNSSARSSYEQRCWIKSVIGDLSENKSMWNIGHATFQFQYTSPNQKKTIHVLWAITCTNRDQYRDPYHDHHLGLELSQKRKPKVLCLIRTL